MTLGGNALRGEHSDFFMAKNKYTNLNYLPLSDRETMNIQTVPRKAVLECTLQ